MSKPAERPALPEGLGLYWHPDSGLIYTRFWINGIEYRRSCGTRDPRVAPVKAAQRRAEAEAKAAAGGDPGRARLDELGVADILARSKKQRTKAHVKSLRSRWAVILRNIGVTYADEVTEQVLLNYEGVRRAGVWGQVRRGKKRIRMVEGWIDRPARGQTIRREVQALCRALDAALSAGKLRALPRIPTIDKDPKDARRSGKRWPTDLIRAWIEALHEDAADETLFAALTGLRYEEVKRVQARWVDLAPKGSETRFLLRIPPEGSKTREERVVGLPEEAAVIVARRHQAEPRKALVFAPSDFRKHRDTKARHLGYPAPPTMRDLRHTAASIALERTSDPGAVMRAFGHRDLRTTEIYISTTVTRVTGVAAAVAEGYGSPKAPDQATGSGEGEAGVSMARDRGFEPLTFGSGDVLAGARWLQFLAGVIDSERLRTAHDTSQPDQGTGSARRKAGGAA